MVCLTSGVPAILKNNCKVDTKDAIPQNRIEPYVFGYIKGKR